MFEENEFVKRIQPSIIRELFEKSKNIEGVVSLGIGEPEKTTPKNIINKAKEALEEGHTHYTSNWGISPLRKAIAEKYKKRGIYYNPKDEIVVTCGGYEALCSTIRAFVNPNDKVIIPDPGWVGYKAYVDMCGAQDIPLSLRPDRGFSIDMDALEEIFKDDIKMMILNSPSNPTGYAYTEDEVKKLVNIAKDNETLIMFDEVYDKFIYDGKKHITPSKYGKENVIVVNSFSKSYAMTGWRVGYALADSSIAKSINKVHQFTTACANSIAQHAAAAALKETQEARKEMIAEYNEKRKFALKKLNEIDRISCEVASGTFYLFPEFKIENMNSFDLSMYLLKEYKVVVIPGSAFGKNGENHFRISYATSIDDIKEGIKRIKEGINSLR